MYWKYSLIPLADSCVYIEDWSVVCPMYDPYKAPELRVGSLYGFADGEFITTSSIVGKNVNNDIVTHSGSVYELGNVNPKYENKFPKAREASGQLAF